MVSIMLKMFSIYKDYIKMYTTYENKFSLNNLIWIERRGEHRKFFVKNDSVSQKVYMS